MVEVKAHEMKTLIIYIFSRHPGHRAGTQTTNKELFLLKSLFSSLETRKKLLNVLSLMPRRAPKV
jgi:hypothetical protein